MLLSTMRQVLQNKNRKETVMEYTTICSKSFKLNIFWLNLLILIRELYQTYYRVFIPAALLSIFLPFLKSPSQLVEGIKNIESILLSFSLSFLILIVTFKMINDNLSHVKNEFKNSLYFVIRHRRKLVLLLFIGGFHGFSELINVLSRENLDAITISFSVGTLNLLLFDYFILETKEHLSDVIFKNTHKFSSDHPLLALTSLGKEKISVLNLQKQYGLPNQVTKGKIELHLKGGLSPIRRSFIRISNSEEELLHSSYTHFLFKIHKIVQFIRAAVLALKERSLKQANRVYFEKQKIMSPKQKTRYTFIVNMSVILAFFILRAWISQ